MKRIISLILTAAMLSCLLTCPAVFAFSDTQGHWAEEILNKWESDDMIDGYADNTFRPDESITRAEFIKVVTVNKKYKETIEVSFADVSGSEWFAPYLKLAAAGQIIAGYEDGTFRPDYPITREEAATILHRAYNPAANAELNFSDSYIISDWAVFGVKALVGTGAINGYPDGTFRPLDFITRAETIKIIDLLTPPEDKPGTTGYLPNPLRPGFSGGGGGGGTNPAPTSTSEPIITRGEWITQLISLSGLSISEDTEREPSFSDIAGRDCENSVEIAVAYGILPIEDENFRPDNPAVREFAAMTAVNYLGFTEEKSLTCMDSMSVSYPSQSAWALNLEMLTLTDNKFLPGKNLNEAEKNKIFNVISEINKSTEIDENHTNTYNYVDGVIQVYTTDYVINGADVSIEKNTQTNNLIPDTVYILLPNDENPSGAAFKVVSITENDNCFEIKNVIPEIYEVFTSIDAMGYAVASDDIIQNQTDDNINLSFGIDEGDDIPLDNAKVEYDFLNTDIGGILKINGKAIAAIPRVKYKVKADIGWRGINAENIYIALDSKIELSADVKLTVDESTAENTVYKIGEIPFNIGPLSVNVVVSLKCEAHGEVKVVYTLEQTQGFQILNNSPRQVKETRQSFSLEKCEATVKAGLLLELNVKLLWWELVSASAWGGVGIDASLKVRDTGLICADTDIYVFLSFNFPEGDCLVKDALEAFGKSQYTWELFDKGNSPLKKNWHFENFHKVDRCTYNSGTGVLNGIVAKAANRELPIDNASIDIYSGSNRIASCKSNESGQYNITLDAGDYTMKVSADGYISFENDIQIRKNETQYVEALLMVSDIGNPGFKGNAFGYVTDTLSGAGIADASIEARAGWSNKSGNVIERTVTGADGGYNVSLPLGNFTLCISKLGYITTYLNIVVIPENQYEQNAALSPTSASVADGELRIVLTWGANPRDLDSHLVGPTDTGGKFHIAYYNETHYNNNGEKMADLDLDDTTSYGPETTTIYKSDAGKYTFFVHHYAGYGTIWNSGAQVRVYQNDSLIASFNPPSSASNALYWAVFEYDSQQKTITPINKICEREPTISVADYDAEENEVDYAEELDRIIEDNKNFYK